MESAYGKRLLKKYGWKEGKGLGKDENGIVQPLKLKLKVGTSGLGHNLGEQFTNDWWVDLFNTAASNIQVDEGKGEVSIETKGKQLNITTKSWMISGMPKKKEKLKYNSFLKTTTLTDTGEVRDDNDENEDDIHDNKEKKRRKEKKYDLAENVEELIIHHNEEIKQLKKKKNKKHKNEVQNFDDDDGDDDCEENNSVHHKVKRRKLTDEELFELCGGRTAHHSARYRGVSVGKLSRIQAQDEQMLNNIKTLEYESGLKKNKKARDK